MRVTCSHCLSEWVVPLPPSGPAYEPPLPRAPLELAADPLHDDLVRLLRDPMTAAERAHARRRYDHLAATWPPLRRCAT